MDYKYFISVGDLPCYFHNDIFCEAKLLNFDEVPFIFFCNCWCFYIPFKKSLGLPCGSVVKNLPANAGDTGSIPGPGSSLEKGMEPHSSILALNSPWTEEPGRLQSMGSQRSQTQPSIEQEEEEEASDCLKVPKTFFYIIFLI